MKNFNYKEKALGKMIAAILSGSSAIAMMAPAMAAEEVTPEQVVNKPAQTEEQLAVKEAARELRARFAAAFEPVPEPAFAAASRYKIVNSVPECWIPFVPVQTPAQQQQIELQRAAMPRILPGDPKPPQKVEPRTSLLRHGLDQANPAPYFLQENEISRAGAQVRMGFQRTRWYNGKVYTWLGIRKTTGRGEGSSGLAFDYLDQEKRESSS